MTEVNNTSDVKKTDRRRVSCDTLCSSNSSCALQRRKPLHPLATSIRRIPSNPVTQRVLSARLHRYKALQNQLNDANFHIDQLVSENKILKNLQKRQDQALSRYEGVQASLPQVLQSHHEEVRVLETKAKNMKKVIKDLSDQIKNKDEEINSLKDQNKYLTTLCKSKNLQERKELTDKVEELKDMLKNNDSVISSLNRKLVIETKNYKFKLNGEIAKHKETKRELAKTLAQLHAVRTNSEKINSQSKCDDKSSDSAIELLINNKISVTKDASDLKPENENTSDNTTDDDHESSTSTDNERINVNNPQDTSSSSDLKSPDQDFDASSELQLKEVVRNWNKKNSKLIEAENNLSKELKKYATSVLEDVKQSNSRIDKHTNDYYTSMQETETLMQCLKETNAKHKRLKKIAASGQKMSYNDVAHFSTKSESQKNVEKLNMTGTTISCNFGEDPVNENAKDRKICEPKGSYKSLNEIINIDFSINKAVKYNLEDDLSERTKTVRIAESDVSSKSEKSANKSAGGKFPFVYNFEEDLFSDSFNTSIKIKSEGSNKKLNEKNTNKSGGKKNSTHNIEDDFLNSNHKNAKPEVGQEDKKKLLKKLKAIDNGDIILPDTKEAKMNLLKEFFDY